MRAHGKAVGLPTEDDMGNSEVGHNALGAGRIYAQGLIFSTLFPSLSCFTTRLDFDKSVVLGWIGLFKNDLYGI